MYELRLAFRNTIDDRLVVEATFDDHPAAETIYEDEDSFLRRLVAADLEFDSTRELVIAVIHAVSDPKRSGQRVPVHISQAQQRILGLNLTPQTSLLPNYVHPFTFLNVAEQFHDFLMLSPTPFVMVSGPEHIVTFINPPYVRILGRTSPDQLLGLPLRECMPELLGQPCHSLLDTTFHTGRPGKRVELHSIFREEDTGLAIDVWFDITYQPVHNGEGVVIGVMAQAADVTERVLARRVAEHREEQIIRLTAELEELNRAKAVSI